MKKNQNFWLGIITFCCFSIPGFNISIAQAQNEIGDFTYFKEAVRERKIVPYPFLREADVTYMMRINRVIDTREKQNIIMNWPKNPFYRMCYEAVTTGYGGPPLPGYRNDSLTTTYTAEEIAGRGGDKELIQVPYDPEDPETEYYDSMVPIPLDPKEIKKFEVMEDWIFDRQRSMFYVRIIAIAPIIQLKASGIDLGTAQLCWIRYTDLMPIMVNQEIFNRHNDAQRLTYLDFFEQRMFSSYVVKESNAFNYYIKDFEEFKTNEFAALLESERIKSGLAEWEHNLWEW